MAALPSASAAITSLASTAVAAAVRSGARETRNADAAQASASSTSVRSDSRPWTRQLTRFRRMRRPSLPIPSRPPSCLSTILVRAESISTLRPLAIRFALLRFGPLCPAAAGHSARAAQTRTGSSLITQMSCSSSNWQSSSSSRHSSASSCAACASLESSQISSPASFSSVSCPPDRALCLSNKCS